MVTTVRHHMSSGHESHMRGSWCTWMTLNSACISYIIISQVKLQEQKIGAAFLCSSIQTFRFSIDRIDFFSAHRSVWWRHVWDMFNVQCGGISHPRIQTAGVWSTTAAAASDFNSSSTFVCAFNSAASPPHACCCYVSMNGFMVRAG